MRVYLTILWILLIVITGCTTDPKVEYDTIPMEEVMMKQQQGFVILDVREHHEFQAGHIPNAQNKPFTDLRLGNFAHLDKTKKYIVVCRSGSRSKDASEILMKQGFTVINVDEGMSSWNGEISK